MWLVSKAIQFSPHYSGGFIPELEQNNRIILAACEEAESGHAYDEWSWYAHYFIEGLKPERAYEGGSTDGSLENAHEYAYQKVQEEAAKWKDTEQHPQIEDDISGKTYLY